MLVVGDVTECKEVVGCANMIDGALFGGWVEGDDEVHEKGSGG